MSSIKTIIEAWKTANNPTPKQTELANLRLKICEECPSKKVLFQKLGIGVICGECGCPIVKKIFTQDINPCPLEKWGEVDKPFFPNNGEKKHRSLT